LLNPDSRGAEKSNHAALKGGAEYSDTEVVAVKARMFRAALVMSVVAVFLEGLGAYMKW
jgi:hypothetical protein